MIHSDREKVFRRNLGAGELENSCVAVSDQAGIRQGIEPEERQDCLIYVRHRIRNTGVGEGTWAFDGERCLGGALSTVRRIRRQITYLCDRRLPGGTDAAGRRRRHEVKVTYAQRLTEALVITKKESLVLLQRTPL